MIQPFFKTIVLTTAFAFVFSCSTTRATVPVKKTVVKEKSAKVAKVYDASTRAQKETLASAKSEGQVDSKLKITAPSHETIPFELFGRLMMVKGEVNGVKGYLFVDSGAPYCVLNSAVFNKIKGKSAKVHGVNGYTAGAKRVKVKSLKFGKVEVKDFKGLCQPLDHLRGAKKVTILGLIGYRELSSFEVLLDYRKKTMMLFKVDENGKKQVKVEIANPTKTIKYTQVVHLPVFDCELNGEKLRMALDTGAEANLLDLKLQGKFAKLLKHRKKTKLIGGDNKPIMVSYGTMPLIKVDGHPFKNMKTVFSDISHLNKGNEGLKVHGLLGFEMLSKTNLVGINFKKKELYIW